MKTLNQHQVSAVSGSSAMQSYIDFERWYTEILIALIQGERRS
ncbi:hypothetical protein ACFO4O_13880 [Glaciecola siphonariae]|uniref:Uncharacterized protein n=1 Tax=Glaciecola siphonariae TaxID=521012 RepID=A0ABV9M0U5_9ALTE